MNAASVAANSCLRGGASEKAIHNDGVLGVYNGRIFGDISDGSSNTMAIGENSIWIVFGLID